MKKIGEALLFIAMMALLFFVTTGLVHDMFPYHSWSMGEQAIKDHQNRLEQFDKYCRAQGDVIDEKSIIDDAPEHWTAGSCYKKVGPDAYEEDIETFHTFTSPGYRGQYQPPYEPSRCVKC